MRQLNIVLRVEIQDGDYIPWEDVEDVLKKAFPKATWVIEPPGMKAVHEIMLPKIYGVGELD